MNVWIATGSAVNLKTSLEKGKWGVNKRLKNSWERVSQGDKSHLRHRRHRYCRGKAEENNILWHDEEVVGRVIYPYRMIFKPLFVLREEKWATDKIAVKDLNLSVRAGLNSVKNEDAVEKLLNRIRGSWGVKV